MKERLSFLLHGRQLLAGSGHQREAIWNCESVTGYLRASAKQTVGVCE